jgi:AcrR family transcriptional regulator
MRDQQRKRSDGRETMSRVMKFAMAEFNKVGPDDFNLDRVLEKSGVSRSSVYHHFGGRHGVIAAVEAKLVEKDIDVNNIGLREFVNVANNAQEILAVIKLEIAQGSKQEDKVTRQRRVSTFVAAQRSELLYEVLQSKQRQATEYLCETLQIATSRGLIKPRVPEMGIAQIMLSLLFGRILVDLVGDETSDQLWTQATLESLEYLLNPQS